MAAVSVPGSSRKPSCTPLARYISILRRSGPSGSEGERTSTTNGGHTGGKLRRWASVRAS